MRQRQEVVIGERRIAVRELTVGEIRKWLKSLESDAGGSIVDAALFADFTLPDLARMSDLSVQDMDLLTPSELALVRDAAKAVNADFFGLRERLVKMAGVTLAPAASA